MINKSPKHSVNLAFYGLFIVLGVLISPQVVSNISKLSISILTGVRIEPIPSPLYGFLHFPNLKPEFKDITFAADFASVYTTAKHLDKPDIYTGEYDVSHRDVPYPPITFFLCNKFLGKLPFGQAALSFLFLQIILLFISSFLVLRYYRLGLIMIPLTVVYSYLLFLTPVGLSWFERGQFDIFPALSILFFMFAVYESKGYAFVLSALFASFKWTACLFFVQGFIIYLVYCFDLKSLKHFSIFAGVLLLTLVFSPYKLILNSFLALYKFQRLSPMGPTLTNRLPAESIYLLLILSLLGYLVILLMCHHKKIFLKTFLPYMTGLLALDLIIISRAFEYRALCFIGFLPMLLPWIIKFKNISFYKIFFVFTFSLFIIAAFHGVSSNLSIYMTDENLTTIYLAYFIMISVLPIFFIAYLNDL